jgi:hypothetical protein
MRNATAEESGLYLSKGIPTDLIDSDDLVSGNPREDSGFDPSRPTMSFDVSKPPTGLEPATCAHERPDGDRGQLPRDVQARPRRRRPANKPMPNSASVLGAGTVRTKRPSKEADDSPIERLYISSLNGRCTYSLNCLTDEFQVIQYVPGSSIPSCANASSQPELLRPNR